MNSWLKRKTRLDRKYWLEIAVDELAAGGIAAVSNAEGQVQPSTQLPTPPTGPLPPGQYTVTLTQADAATLKRLAKNDRAECA